MSNHFQQSIDIFKKAWKAAIKNKNYKESYNINEWITNNQIQPIGLLEYYNIDTSEVSTENIKLLFANILGYNSFSELSNLRNQELEFAKLIISKCTNVTILKHWRFHTSPEFINNFATMNISEKLKLAKNFFPGNSFSKKLKNNHQEQRITKSYKHSNDCISFLDDCADAEPDYAHWKYD